MKRLADGSEAADQQQPKHRTLPAIRSAASLHAANGAPHEAKEPKSVTKAPKRPATVQGTRPDEKERPRAISRGGTAADSKQAGKSDPAIAEAKNGKPAAAKAGAKKAGKPGSAGAAPVGTGATEETAAASVNKEAEKIFVEVQASQDVSEPIDVVCRHHSRPNDTRIAVHG